MSKNRDIEIKQQVLEMLKNFMLGEDGKKFAPKQVSVEVEGVASKGGLADVLKDAAMAKPMDKDESCEEVEDEDDEEEKPRMSLKDFLSR